MMARAREADLAANVAMINACIEPIVLAHMDQWYMQFDCRFDD